MLQEGTLSKAEKICALAQARCHWVGCDWVGGILVKYVSFTFERLDLERVVGCQLCSGISCIGRSGDDLTLSRRFSSVIGFA